MPTITLTVSTENGARIVAAIEAGRLERQADETDMQLAKRWIRSETTALVLRNEQNTAAASAGDAITEDTEILT